MAIAFDTVNKIIKLDRFVVSNRDLWTAYVNWAVLSDNIKYGAIMSQLGGNVPIALYIYLENGWKIRPMEANGVTTITGNILTHDGSSPIVSTLGNWNILVNMETPVKATAIASGGTSTDLTSVISAISALNNISVSDIENSSVLAKEATISSVSTKIDNMQTIINNLMDATTGRWEILNNQMIFYRSDNSVLMRFNLFDKAGNPTETSVYDRVPV